MTSTGSTPDVPSPGRRLFARDQACHTLGIELEETGPGHARLRMRVTEAMANGHGTAHGGYLFLLADAAFAVACNSHGPAAVAQGAQITFVRPAAVGDDLHADAVERSRYGRVGVYDVTVRHVDGPVVAEFRGQSALVAGVVRPDRTRPDPHHSTGGSDA